MSAADVTEATVKELADLAQLGVELAKRAGADHAEVPTEASFMPPVTLGTILCALRYPLFSTV